jgi:hypothetical protein
LFWQLLPFITLVIASFQYNAYKMEYNKNFGSKQVMFTI